MKCFMVCELQDEVIFLLLLLLFCPILRKFPSGEEFVIAGLTEKVVLYFNSVKVENLFKKEFISF